MFENSTNFRTRDAIRAAHTERSQAFLNGLRYIFGGARR